MKKLLFAFVLIVFATSIASALSVSSVSAINSGRVYSFQITGATVNSSCTFFTQVSDFILDFAQYDEKLVRIYPDISSLKANAQGHAYYSLKIDNRYPVGENFTLNVECDALNTTKNVTVNRQNFDVETSNSYVNWINAWSFNQIALGIIVFLMAIFLLIIMLKMIKKA